MKNPAKILMPNEYAPLGEGLIGVKDRFSVYEDLVPYFPVIHVDEVLPTGELASAEFPKSRGFVVSQDFNLSGGFFIDCPDIRFYAQHAADEAHSSLAAACRNLRAGERLQFVWMINDRMDRIFEGFGQTFPEDPPLVKFIRSKRFERDRLRFEDGRLRQFTAACFLQTPFEGKVVDFQNTSGPIDGFVDSFLGALSVLKTSKKMILSDGLLGTMPAWQDRIRSVEQSFSNVRGLRTRPVHASDYQRFYRRLLSPDLWDKVKKDSRFAPEVDSAAPYAAQCMGMGSRVHDYGAYFVTGSYYHRVLTIEVPPSFVEMGYLMTALTHHELLSETKNLQVTLNVTPRSRAKELTALRRRRDFILKQYRVDVDKNSHLKAQLEQLNAQIDELENNERSSLFSAVLMVHLWEKDPRRLSAAETALIGVVSRITTAVFGAEEMAALPYMLHYGLPGCPGKGDKHRQLAMTDEETAPLIPLMGQGCGVLADTPNPLVPTMFETDLANPIAIDFFARKRVSNYNGIAVGGSGSGKSFLFNSIVTCYANRKTRVIIIDAAEGAPAYKTMCKLIGGVYIDRTFRINALGTRTDGSGNVMNPSEEEMAGIIATLEAMLRKSEREPLEPNQKAFLTESVNYLFNNRPDTGVPYLRHLPEAMTRCAEGRVGTYYQELAQDYCQILRSSWTYPNGENVNAKYVDGPDDFEQSWLTVFDLKWALKKPELLTVEMTLIFRYISRITAHNETLPDGEREKIIVLTDEGWKALFDPAFANLYLGLYKAGRSRNIAALLLTQDFSDLIVFLKRLLGAGEEVKTSPLITSSSHFFIAKVDYKEAERIGEVLNLPKSQWEQFAELKRIDGFCSQYGYLARLSDSANLMFTKFAYVPLPEELWSFTSQSDDDGVRISMMEQLREDLQRPGVRDALLDEMAKAGWDRDGLAAIQDENRFVAHVMVARQAAKMRKAS